MMPGRVMIPTDPKATVALDESCFVCTVYAKHSFDQHHKEQIGAAQAQAAAEKVPGKIIWVSVSNKWICPPVNSAITYGLCAIPALAGLVVPLCWSHCPSMAPPGTETPAQHLPPAPPGWRPQSGRN